MTRLIDSVAMHTERRETLLRAILFNNQYADFREPDWSLFDHIEVKPVARYRSDDDKAKDNAFCEPCEDGEEPDTWSVYGVYRHWRPWQLANDREAYGDNALKWILVSPDGEQEHPAHVIYATEQDAQQAYYAGNVGSECITDAPTEAVANLIADIFRERLTP